MNTDQAYDLLKTAGVSDDISIQTVRRWLREQKINFAGKTRRGDTDYILNDTDQAINLLKDAGVAPNIGIQVVKRWLHEGKIEKIGKGSQIVDYLKNESNPNRLNSGPPDLDRTIRDLKIKIKAQDDHIKGLQEIHKTSIHALSQQRNKLHKELVKLESENNKLQTQSKKVLEENIELRKAILKLKEELIRQGKRDSEKPQSIPTPNTHDYRQKLGLSRTADQKQVLAAFKKLLKLTHPDHGGNAAAFHYIKTEYDQFKNSF
ncbi:J domain-containing protein [Neobacillus dielmonensis]|uniref:hypothetical protein n=1 Tax=Neobacillus dielmonensis TaxID=1347369 RepID=UPI0005AB3341|nr:hypothetical protein [Neobacillus dielmonensis]